MKIAVTIDGKAFECTSDEPDRHGGITCPIHEDKASPAYAPTLGRVLPPQTLEVIERVTIAGFSRRAAPEEFIVAWTGGLESPQFQACTTDTDAHALAEKWAADLDSNGGDRIDVLRIDTATLAIEVLWTL